MSKFLTTNEIGNFIGVSERTVANWIDRGYLPAFRTPGGHRRVEPKALAGFLVQRGIPVPEGLEAGPSRILIVEDDAAVADTMRGFLSDAGDDYDTHVFHDGVSALIDIGRTPPRLVLLDVVMPGMDGLAVCRQIRANPALAETQVLFVTGSSSLDVPGVLRETGACGVLFKPVRKPDLHDIVQVVLGRAPIAIPRR